MFNRINFNILIKRRFRYIINIYIIFQNKFLIIQYIKNIKIKDLLNY